MRIVVVGAGAVGGVVGARLALSAGHHGHEVVLVARGEHGAAIAEQGLRLRSPESDLTVDVEVVPSPRALLLGDDDLVLLAVKGQDTSEAVADLEHGPPDLAIACLQNGVENERVVARRTPRTYAVPVVLPATYLVPGVVDEWSTPCPGILDVGRYPTGVDDTASALSVAFAAAGFSSRTDPAIMRFKWAKLLLNLGNVLEASSGPGGRGSVLYDQARAEGRAVLAAAGIDAATDEEDAARRGDLIRMRPIGEERRGGGSTWQSLTRGTPTLETDLLNGEIARLGREHGVATPVNDLLVQVGHELLADRTEPGSIPIELLEARALG